MARLRFDGIGDPAGSVNPITIASSGATTCSWTSAPAFPTIAAPDYVAVTVKPGNPLSSSNIIYITAYTSGATTATITQGNEGSTAAAATSAAWTHASTAYDFSIGASLQAAAAVSTPIAFTSGAPVLTAGTTVYDGYTLQAGDRVFLPAQSTSSQNGLWQVPATGSVGFRPVEFPTAVTVFGTSVKILNGGVFAGATYSLGVTTSGVTVDTSAQTWTFLNQAPTQNSSTTATQTLLPNSVNVYTTAATGAGSWTLPGNTAGTAASPLPYIGCSVTIANHSNFNITITGGGARVDYMGNATGVAVIPPGRTVNAAFGLNVFSQNIWYVTGGSTLASPVYDVCLFGADPTGVADSTTAIHAALTACGAAGGGVVFFPLGVYAHTGLIAGNGTSSVPSTINGIILRGATPPDAELWDSTTYTTGVTLKYTGASSGNAVLIQGPLRGFGVENFLIDGNSLAGNGLNLTSASGGTISNVAFKGCSQNGVVLATAAGGATYNSMHNVFNNIHVSVPDVNNAEGIGMTSAFSSSDPCYNTFRDVEVTFPNTTSGHTCYGVYNGVSDNNDFHNLHFINVDVGSGGTNVCLVFDYTGATASLPSDNTYSHIDFGTSTTAHAITKFGNSNDVGNNCLVYDIAHCNGQPADPGYSSITWRATMGAPGYLSNFYAAQQGIL